jgi:hypothetical protein
MKNIVKFLFIGVLTLTGCTKISTPNENAQKIFGKWDYKSNSGGFSGAGGSNSFFQHCWIDITEQGKFNVFEGTNQISTRNFTVEMKESIVSLDPLPALVYENGEYETYRFFGDTLLLREEQSDGYSFVFVKK